LWDDAVQGANALSPPGRRSRNQREQPSPQLLSAFLSVAEANGNSSLRANSSGRKRKGAPEYEATPSQIATRHSRSGISFKQITGCAKSVSRRMCWVRCLFASRISGKPGEEGKIYILHICDCHFFTRKRSKVLRFRTHTTQERGKVTVEKMSNLTGATPLFRLSAAQKVRGVAPARHASCVTVFCPRAAEEQRVCQTRGLPISKQKGENDCQF
jgi:hypothetical protein